MAEATKAAAAAPAAGAPPATPPPAAAAKPAAETPPAGTAERAFGSRLRGGTQSPQVKPGEEGKTPAAAPAKQPEKKKEDDAAAAPAVPDPKAVAPAKRTIRRAPGYEDVPKLDQAATAMTDAATKLAGAVEKFGQPAAPKPAAAATVELTPEEQEEITVLEAMGELDKAKWGHLATSAQKYIAELPQAQEKWEDKFRTDWEKKNADKFEKEEERDTAFADARASAYEKFLGEQRKKHKLDYTDSDFSKGVRYLDRKPFEEQLKAQKEEIQRLSGVQKQQEAAPVAKQAGATAVADLAQHSKVVGAEFEGILTEEGEIDDAVLGKIKDANLVKPLFEEAKTWSQDFAEAAVLVEQGQPSKLTGQVHATIRMFEQETAAKPENERKDEKGRQFAAIADYVQMVPEQQAKHWIVDSEQLIGFANDKILERVTSNVKAEREKEAARRKALLEEYGVTEEELAALKKKGSNGAAAPAAKPAGEEATRTPKPAMATSPEGSPAQVPAGGGDNGRSFLQSRFSQPEIAGR